MGQFRPFFESLTGPRELVLDGQAALCRDLLSFLRGPFFSGLAKPPKKAKAQPSEWAKYLEKAWGFGGRRAERAGRAESHLSCLPTYCRASTCSSSLRVGRLQPSLQARFLVQCRAQFCASLCRSGAP